MGIHHGPPRLAFRLTDTGETTGVRRQGKVGSEEVTSGQTKTPARSATSSRELSSEAMIQRLKLLVFEGMNLEGWIFRAEHYFAICRLREVDKLEAAVNSLDRKSLAWFQWADE